MPCFSPIHSLALVLLWFCTVLTDACDAHLFSTDKLAIELLFFHLQTPLQPHTSLVVSELTDGTVGITCTDPAILHSAILPENLSRPLFIHARSSCILSQPTLRTPLLLITVAEDGRSPASGNLEVVLTGKEGGHRCAVRVVTSFRPAHSPNCSRALFIDPIRHEARLLRKVSHPIIVTFAFVS